MMEQRQIIIEVGIESNRDADEMVKNYGRAILEFLKETDAVKPDPCNVIMTHKVHWGRWLFRKI